MEREMNERLNNLVGQAKVMAEETLNKQISKNAELDAFAEKFAELIVQECLEQLNISNVPAPISAGLNLGRVAIKEHFGVEE
jgi:hypothetical protein